MPGGTIPPDNKPRPPAGPGKFANRQDLSQPIATPNDLPYGDRKRLEEAQRQAPAPNNQATPAPQGSAPALAPPQPPVEGGGLPDLLSILSRPTNRPDEAVSTGLVSGPGAGPEALFPDEEQSAQRVVELALAALDPDMPPEIQGLGALLQFIISEREKQNNQPLAPEDEALLDEEMLADMELEGG